MKARSPIQRGRVEHSREQARKRAADRVALGRLSGTAEVLRRQLDRLQREINDIERRRK